ncbi:MAG: pilin [Candidatus Pacebacteria bacterium]|nr:pilin [Candidatus Paceibacterota bacterium]
MLLIPNTNKKIILILLLIFLAGAFNVGCSFAKSDICGPCCEKADCKVGECVGSGKDSADKPCLIQSDDKGVITIKQGKGGQCQKPDETTFCPLSSYTEVDKLVEKVSNWIFILALVVAPLMILLGGFYMLTAVGDPKRSTQGKQIIMWAVIGLAVILFAKAFVSIIKSLL